jgi:prolyl-tRNA editing enzyme YbaK/EbsC (Cys-tRNA(Pro) deacylase)
VSSVSRWEQVVEGIKVEVLEFSDTVESVDKASKLSGEPSSKIVKTLLLKVGDSFVVAVVRGDRRVDYGKASKVFGLPVALAKREEVLNILNVEPGAVTPLSSRVRSLNVVLDPAILVNEYILCGGGSTKRLYKVKTSDLVEYLKPIIVDIFK